MCCRVCECICSVLHMKISGGVCIRMRAEELLFSRNVLCVSESLCVTGFVCVCVSVFASVERFQSGLRLSAACRELD